MAEPKSRSTPLPGSETAAWQLADMRARLERDPGLGCSLVAHRDLGFCSHCPVPYDDGTQGWRREIAAWRLLSMAQEGVPLQPSENNPSGAS